MSMDITRYKTQSSSANQSDFLAKMKFRCTHLVKGTDVIVVMFKGKVKKKVCSLTIFLCILLCTLEWQNLYFLILCLTKEMAWHRWWKSFCWVRPLILRGLHEILITYYMSKFALSLSHKNVEDWSFQSGTKRRGYVCLETSFISSWSNKIQEWKNREWNDSQQT